MIKKPIFLMLVVILALLLVSCATGTPIDTGPIVLHSNQVNPANWANRTSAQTTFNQVTDAAESYLNHYGHFLVLLETYPGLGAEEISDLVDVRLNSLLSGAAGNMFRNGVGLRSWTKSKRSFIEIVRDRYPVTMVVAGMNFNFFVLYFIFSPTPTVQMRTQDAVSWGFRTSTQAITQDPLITEINFITGEEKEIQNIFLTEVNRVLDRVTIALDGAPITDDYNELLEALLTDKYWLDVLKFRFMN